MHSDRGMTAQIDRQAWRVRWKHRNRNEVAQCDQNRRKGDG